MTMRVMGWPAFKNKAHNPYNWLLYTHMAPYGAAVEEFSAKQLAKGGVDVWHMHWPDGMLNHPNKFKAWLRAQMLLATMDLARLRGTKLVWTAHNLHAHERFHPDMEARFWRQFTKRLDGYISLSEAGKQAACDAHEGLRRLPGFVVPHGHYRGMYPDTITREAARQKLGVSDGQRVLVFVGQIRPYKNVPHLVREFRAMNDENAVLFIAGKPNLPSLADEIRAAADGAERVHLQLGFVPDEDMQVYLRAADLVVLPYEEILNSGSALLALSFDRPVLVPNKGSLQEIQGQVGSEWVHAYSGSFTRSLLQEGLRWAVTTERAERAPLEQLEWSELARLTLEAYRGAGR